MGILNLFVKRKEYEPAEIYLELRNNIFSLTKEKVNSLLEPSMPLIGVGFSLFAVRAGRVLAQAFRKFQNS